MLADLQREVERFSRLHQEVITEARLTRESAEAARISSRKTRQQSENIGRRMNARKKR